MIKNVHSLHEYNLKREEFIKIYFTLQNPHILLFYHFNKFLVYVSIGFSL